MNKNITVIQAAILIITTIIITLLVVYIKNNNWHNNSFNPRYIVNKSNILVTNESFNMGGNYSWSIYKDTKSMLPLFGNNSIGIYIPVDSATELFVGDIVTYTYNERFISHRILEINKDIDGVYYIMKGDNNKQPDNVKVRREQVQRLLVGIIW